MADTTVQDHEHGTPGGATAHRRAGTTLCTPCRDADNDYRQAWRIVHDRETVRVPVTVLRAILRGARPAQALACLGGPRTLHALREGTVPRG